MQAIRYLIKSISMEAEEKQRLMVRADYKPVSEPRGKPVKKISRCWAPRCRPQSIFYSLDVSGGVICVRTF